MKAIPLGCVFDPGLVNRNIASVGERQETTIPTTAEARRLAAALELFLLLIDCLVALVCIVSDAGGRLGRDDPGPFVLNDLVPPLFTLVVGAVPRPRLGPFLAKDPGSQDRRGGFHAVAEDISKALVAQHLLVFLLSMPTSTTTIILVISKRFSSASRPTANVWPSHVLPGNNSYQRAEHFTVICSLQAIEFIHCRSNWQP